MIPSCSAPTLKDSPPSAAHTIPRHRVWLGALALAVAVALAYSNACTVPFLLDDATSIESNASLHSWRTVLFPPSDRSETVGGRPLLNVSLALNYAISGTSVWSYHLVNVLIHVCAALALFGLVRRTLVKCGMNEHGAFWCALAAAGIWALHPLLTEAVTYIVQRAESLMAMWYLLTLYCFARAADAEGKVAQAILPVQGGATANSTGKRRLSRNVNNTCSKTGDLMECGDLSPLLTSRLAGSQQCMHEARRCGVTSPAVKSVDKSPHSMTRQVARQSQSACATFWLTASVVFCALGMATKEVMVSAPVLVLLYDRAFVSGSFRATFRARWKFHAALAATWLVLAAGVLSAGDRGKSAGFDMAVAWWSYALTQCKAILIYIKLVVWPSPLVFEYDCVFINSPWPVLPHIIAVSLLAAAALFAMFRWPRAGFPGALFFAVLAPTSSFLPIITQTMAERRMYLPSAAIIVLVVVACHRFARRRSPAMLKAAGLAACAVAVTLGALTWQRNQVYRSELSIWTDTAQKAPQNRFAQLNAGISLIEAKRHGEGIALCLEAARLHPDFGSAWCYAGVGLFRMGRFEEAVPCLEKAVFYNVRGRPLGSAPQRGAPGIADLDHLDNVYLFLGMALHELGRDAEARAALAKGVAHNPLNAWCLNNLGNSDYAAGDYAAAESHYRRAITVSPRFAEAHGGLAGALEQLGRDAEARAHYEQALRLNPDLAHVHYHYARLLARFGATEPARTHAREALRLRPD